MSQNTSLFPTEFSNLCPGTQTDEADRFDDLERKLLILRYQHLAGLKKDGQSIAELQNATLEIANNLFPAIQVGRTYMGGGEKYGVHGQIDKFTHASESVNTQDFALTTPRLRHAGAASAARGYWAGGETNLTGTKISNVEAIVFETETKASVSATLSVATSYFRGVASTLKAYFGGNFNPASGKIDALTFSSEAIAALVATLPSVTGGNNAFASTTKGYWSSGWNGTRNINALTFSGETTAALAALLSVIRLEGGNFASASKGFVCSGQTSLSSVLLSQTVDALTFSNDTVALVANALTTYADADMDGASALRKGYAFGGLFSAAFGGNIDGFDFAAETIAPVGSLLTRGGRYPTPVGKP